MVAARAQSRCVRSRRLLIRRLGRQGAADTGGDGWVARYASQPNDLVASLAPEPNDPAFPAYQQFLHLGEAGPAASIYFVVGARHIAPEAGRQNWTAGQPQRLFDSRLGLVTRQLARPPYLAGEMFKAADISVIYAMELARRAAGVIFGEAEQACMARVSGREAYRRATETCQATKAWAAQASDL
jgi:glutathione S-transferase